MRVVGILAACLLLLPLVGCRNRAAQELLERDLRVQEDIIYDLEDEIKSLCAENEALRQMAFSGATPTEASERPKTNRPAADNSTRESTFSDSPSVPGDTRSAPAMRGDEPRSPSGAPANIETKPPVIELPGRPQAAPRFEGPPAIIAPGEGFPEGELPAPKTVPSSAPSGVPARNASLGTRSESGPTMAAPTNATAPSEQVMAISLHETATAGYNDDGQPGDDGVRVVIEPRDAQGNLLAAPAKISVVLMDPLQSGNAARLGRWDFTVEQAAMSYAKSAESEGLHLELPWYQAVPQHGELHMFVRYHTADGRKIDVDRSLTVALRPQAQRPPALPVPSPGMSPQGMPQPGMMPQQFTGRSPGMMPRGGMMTRGMMPNAKGQPMPSGQPASPGGRVLPQRSNSPYSSVYDRVPATTERPLWSRNPTGPTARLMPPQFTGAATPLETVGPQPAASPPAQSVAPAVSAPRGESTNSERPRTGAKWSPYR